MSEQLQKELNEANLNLLQTKARLNANEEFTNGLLKDLIDTKTNLLLFKQTNFLVSQEKLKLESELKEMREKNESISAELAGLKGEDTNL